MQFTKVQGAGNDFVLIEAEATQVDWAKKAKAMCDRRFGVGSDGIILLLPSDVADFRMRMFNPDGTEAEACGNGLRCLVKYVVVNNLIERTRNGLTIETAVGIRHAKLQRYEDGRVYIQISMGKPVFASADIPFAPDKAIDLNQPVLNYGITVNDTPLKLNVVSMGNPHAIFFTSQPVGDFPLETIGPKVEHLPLFPQRVNFEVAQVKSRHEIDAVVWERGAGVTLACGTGACAIAVTGQLNNYIDNKVDIKLPGGTLNVEWDGKGEVFLGGPAEVVFTGNWGE